jgi:uncharacterized OB-fold protein
VTEMIECPSCGTFVVPPGRCPDCGAEVAMPNATSDGPDTVVQYRLNHLASASGIALGALVVGSITTLVGPASLGVGLILLGLAWAAILLIRE